MKVLFYAINGIGMGHLTRQYAIARELDSLLRALGQPADIRFLTSSEAPGLVQEFPAYKLPSRTLFQSRRLSGFEADCKLMISSLMAGFRPDILVMDTQAGGSFGEFAFVRDFASLRVFIDRHRDQSGETGARHLQQLLLYELVLVPDRHERRADYSLPQDFQGRRSFIGPVTLFRGGLDPGQLRAEFGWDAGSRVAYVSAGGGGDPLAAGQMDFLVSQMLERGYHVLAGYGPLYRGRRQYGQRVVPLTEMNVSTYFPGLDLAVSAAGYNSYQELLAASVPTLFYAQPKQLDQQQRRIRIGLEQGWHGELSELSPAALDAGLAWLADQREALQTRLQQRPPALGGLKGAYEMLAVYAVRFPGKLDPQALAFATVALRNWQAERQVYEQGHGLQYFCWFHATVAEARGRTVAELLAGLETTSSAPLYAGLAAGLLALLQRYGPEVPGLEALLQQLIVRGLKQPEPDKNHWADQMQAWLELWPGLDVSAPDLSAWLQAATEHLPDLAQLPALTLELAQSHHLLPALAACAQAPAAEREKFFRQPENLI